MEMEIGIAIKDMAQEDQEDDRWGLTRADLTILIPTLRQMMNPRRIMVMDVITVDTGDELRYKRILVVLWIKGCIPGTAVVIDS
jgi:hypothetical protein